MRLQTVFLCPLVLALTAAAAVAADVRFEDDFSSGTVDPARWTKLEDAGCSVAVNGGLLQASFDGATAPRHAYVESAEVPLPSGWTSCTLTGQWAYAQSQTGEMLMRLWDAADEDAYAQVRYQT